MLPNNHKQLTIPISLETRARTSTKSLYLFFAHAQTCSPDRLHSPCLSRSLSLTLPSVTNTHACTPTITDYLIFFRGRPVAMKFSLYFTSSYFLRCFVSFILGRVYNVHLCTFSVFNSLRVKLFHTFFSGLFFWCRSTIFVCDLSFFLSITSICIWR